MTYPAIRTDAILARSKATRWLVDEVGNLLLGGAPSLVIADRILWRVPVLLASFEQGIIGQVGTVDVDARTGKVLASPELVQELTKNSRQLGHGVASSKKS